MNGDIDFSWTPAKGDRCMYVPHHPAFKAPEEPHVIREILPRDDGSHSYWIEPTGPVRTRTLRNGRVVEDRPNWQCLVARSELRRCPT